MLANTLDCFPIMYVSALFFCCLQLTSITKLYFHPNSIFPPEFPYFIVLLHMMQKQQLGTSTLTRQSLHSRPRLSFSFNHAHRQRFVNPLSICSVLLSFFDKKRMLSLYNLFPVCCKIKSYLPLTVVYIWKYNNSCFSLHCHKISDKIELKIKRFHIISLQIIILFFLKFKKQDEDNFSTKNGPHPPRKFSQRIYMIHEIGPATPQKSGNLAKSGKLSPMCLFTSMGNMKSLCFHPTITLNYLLFCIYNIFNIFFPYSVHGKIFLIAENRSSLLRENNPIFLKSYDNWLERI